MAPRASVASRSNVRGSWQAEDPERTTVGEQTMSLRATARLFVRRRGKKSRISSQPPHISGLGRPSVSARPNRRALTMVYGRRLHLQGTFRVQHGAETERGWVGWAVA